MKAVSLLVLNKSGTGNYLGSGTLNKWTSSRRNLRSTLQATVILKTSKCPNFWQSFTAITRILNSLGDTQQPTPLNK